MFFRMVRKWKSNGFRMVSECFPKFFEYAQNPVIFGSGFSNVSGISNGFRMFRKFLNGFRMVSECFRMFLNVFECFVKKNKKCFSEKIGFGCRLFEWFSNGFWMFWALRMVFECFESFEWFPNVSECFQVFFEWFSNVFRIFCRKRMSFAFYSCLEGTVFFISWCS